MSRASQKRSPSNDALSDAGLKRRVRCAVYTRKSSEEGLEMEFNSLDAQREACEAYIASQRQEGWTLVPDYFDDGGISGATLERPALKRLLADIEAGKVDVVVVYKIDRLSRSLMDFARLVDVFDRKEVTFVSITQSFNTTTSMGRLTLNILLSFAQFEREVIGERIRDKFAASRRKGIWMGGTVPLGYEVKNRKLIIHENEAKIVRHVFERFALLGSASRLVEELNHEGYGNRSGKAFDKGSIYKLINNRVYVGLAVHKGEAFTGEHAPIVDQALWDRVQAMLQESPRARAMNARRRTPALLRGLIFDANSTALSPGHTRKNGRLYRYYISQDVLKGRVSKKGGAANRSEDSESSAMAGSSGASECAVDASTSNAERNRINPVRRVPAGEIEAQVIVAIRELLQAPEAIAGVWKAVKDHDVLDNTLANNPDRGPAGKMASNRNNQKPALAEYDVRKALSDFDALWDQLFPVEQHRIVQLLVERVIVASDELIIRLRVEGFASLLGELRGEAERSAGPDGKAKGHEGNDALHTSDNKCVSKPRKQLQEKNRARAA